MHHRASVAGGLLSHVAGRLAPTLEGFAVADGLASAFALTGKGEAGSDSPQEPRTEDAEERSEPQQGERR